MRPRGGGESPRPRGQIQKGWEVKNQKEEKKKKRTKKRDHVLRMAETRGEKRVRDKN